MVDEGGQKVHISSYGDIMNSMVTIVNSTVYSSTAKRVNLKSSIIK